MYKPIPRRAIKSKNCVIFTAFFAAWARNCFSYKHISPEKNASYHVWFQLAKLSRRFLKAVLYIRRAVILLEYCRYGVKHQSINQSIKYIPLNAGVISILDRVEPNSSILGHNLINRKWDKKWDFINNSSIDDRQTTDPTEALYRTTDFDLLKTKIMKARPTKVNDQSHWTWH